MYRRLECSTWDDPWFSELDPDAKLLFLYLITNRRTTACGAFEITLRAMAFETGLPNVEATIAKLGDRVVWWPQHQAIFVRNFFRWQSDSTNKSNFRVGAMKALAQFPIEIVETVTNVYPELRENGGSHPHPIPIPSPTHGEEETVTVTVEETEGANAPSRAHANGSSYPEAFITFWDAYPRKVGKDDAFKAWRQLRPTHSDLGDMLDAIATQKQSDDWRKDAGRFIPHPGRWLRAGRWKDEGTAIEAEHRGLVV